MILKSYNLNRPIEAIALQTLSLITETQQMCNVTTKVLGNASKNNYVQPSCWRTSLMSPAIMSHKILQKREKLTSY